MLRHLSQTLFYRTAIKSACQMLITLGVESRQVYEEVFERHFLRVSADYYHVSHFLKFFCNGLSCVHRSLEKKIGWFLPSLPKTHICIIFIFYLTLQWSKIDFLMTAFNHYRYLKLWNYMSLISLWCVVFLSCMFSSFPFKEHEESCFRSR